MRIFVPDEEGELLGDRAVVICSEVEGNRGARVTESAEEIHESVARCFGLAAPVWIENHDPSVTDGATETWELVVFTAFGKPSWKPLDRSTVETLVGHRL